MAQLISGERVNLMRLAAQLSQTDLATKIGLSGNSMMSKIENGRIVNVDESILRGLSISLDCSPDLLASPPADILSTRPWLRAYADARAKVLDAIVADNRLQHELVESLGLKRIPVSIPEFTSDANDPDAIEAYAHEMRTEAGVEEGAVVKNTVRAAERLGCVVLPLDGELNQRHLGMSQLVDGIPYIRVSRPWTSERRSIPGDRQRFTVAHELGHLGIHVDLAPPQTSDEASRIEKQAHRFAGAFLAPAEALIEDLNEYGGRVTLNTLAKLKSKWGLAIKALIVRLQQLGIVSSDQALSLYKQISSRGWNLDEPVKVTNETPVWYERALSRAAGDAPDIVRWASNEYGLGPGYHKRWLNWAREGDQSPAEPISIQGRRSQLAREPSSGSVGASEITQLIPRH